MNPHRMFPIPRGPFRAIMLEFSNSSSWKTFQPLYYTLTFGHPNFSHSLGDKNKIVIYYKYAYDVANILESHKFHQTVLFTLFEDQASKTLHPQVLYVETSMKTRDIAKKLVHDLGGNIIHESRQGIQIKFRTFKLATVAQEELRLEFLTKFCYKTEVRIPIDENPNSNQEQCTRNGEQRIDVSFKEQLRTNPEKQIAKQAYPVSDTKTPDNTQHSPGSSKTDQETLHSQLQQVLETYKTFSVEFKSEFKKVFKSVIDDEEETRSKSSTRDLAQGPVIVNTNDQSASTDHNVILTQDHKPNSPLLVIAEDERPARSEQARNEQPQNCKSPIESIKLEYNAGYPKESLGNISAHEDDVKGIKRMILRSGRSLNQESLVNISAHDNDVKGSKRKVLRSGRNLNQNHNDSLLIGTISVSDLRKAKPKQTKARVTQSNNKSTQSTESSNDSWDTDESSVSIAEDTDLLEKLKHRKKLLHSKIRKSNLCEN